MGIHTHTWLNLEKRKDENIKQSDGYIVKSWGHKREADQSRISVRWSKWFKEAKTADHSFSSISFQRLTKIARHFKLLSVPHSECSASIASKLWKPQDLPMVSLKHWINSSSVWTWINYNLAIKQWRFDPLKSGNLWVPRIQSWQLKLCSSSCNDNENSLLSNMLQTCEIVV